MTAADPHRSPEPASEPENAGDGYIDARSSIQRAKIHQELIRIRRRAAAARLEAQANRLDDSAEKLECLLARIDAGETITPAQFAHLGLDALEPLTDRPEPVTDGPESAAEPPLAPKNDASKSIAPKIASSAEKTPASAPETSPQPTESGTVRFDSWDAIREAQHKSPPVLRHDTAHTSVKAPRMNRGADRIRPPARPIEPQEESDQPRETPQPLRPSISSSTPASAAGKRSPPSPNRLPDQQASRQPASTLPKSPVILQADDAPVPHRRRSVAVIASAAVHVVIVLVLAALTLSTAMPKDQVALSASVTSASEESIETFQIETAEPTVDPTQSTPDEAQVELDPLGEMVAVEVTPGMTTAENTAPPMNSFGQPRSASDSSLQALKSDSRNKMQFCGVEGGGNHFVYLVDSSGSMGDAFISARRALIESIEMLSAEQRFYVIFFDANCDYMRITRADQDEPRSVKATPENKQRLKSWAMRIEMDRGKAPYEPIKYALQKLKPDVIFLLSDGEFPQGIEDLFEQQNKITNLFGETHPVSIVHTISYHSREGESRMQRIAANNFGQYRHVPKP